jgi:hypothetical protein
LVHLCVFGTSGSFTLGAAGSSLYGTSPKASVVRYNVPNILPATTNLTASETGLGAGNINLNKTTTLPTEKASFSASSDNFTTLTLNMTTSNQYVSPVVDIDRANVNVIESKISNVDLTSVNTNETNSSQSGASVLATARYITKRVVLEPGMEATNLRVDNVRILSQGNLFQGLCPYVS